MTDWKETLKTLLREAEERRSARERQEEDDKRRRVKHFVEHTVVPAFEEVAEALQEHGRDVEVDHGRDFATITVRHEGKQEFFYGIRARAYREREFSFPVLPLRDAEGRTYRAEAFLRGGALKHDVTDYSKEEIIRSFLYEYRRHLRWLL